MQKKGLKLKLTKKPLYKVGQNLHRSNVMQSDWF